MAGRGAQHGVGLRQQRGQLAQGVGLVKGLAQRRPGAAHSDVAAAEGPCQPGERRADVARAYHQHGVAVQVQRHAKVFKTACALHVAVLRKIVVKPQHGGQRMLCNAPAERARGIGERYACRKGGASAHAVIIHPGGGKLYPFQPPAQRQLFGRHNAEYHVGPGQTLGIEGLVVPEFTAGHGLPQGLVLLTGRHAD